MEALTSGRQPLISNTYQGSQFTPNAAALTLIMSYPKHKKQFARAANRTYLFYSLEDSREQAVKTMK